MDVNREEVEQAVLEVLGGMLPHFDSQQQDANLSSDLGLDSMQVMNLAMELEDRLDITIPVEVLAEAGTLRELIARLSNCMETSAP
jgi:acyl carrier protein